MPGARCMCSECWPGGFCEGKAEIQLPAHTHTQSPGGFQLVILYTKNPGKAGLPQRLGLGYSGVQALSGLCLASTYSCVRDELCLCQGVARQGVARSFPGRPGKVWAPPGPAQASTRPRSASVRISGCLMEGTEWGQETCSVRPPCRMSSCSEQPDVRPRTQEPDGPVTGSQVHPLAGDFLSHLCEVL